MKLLVVRHAVAMERSVFQARARVDSPEAGEDFAADDDDRPLTLDGIRKMRKNVKGLRELIEAPDLLVSSPLTRAQQTAEILCETWRGLEFTTIDSLRPGSDPDDFCDWLSARNGIVAIVGHEPHLSGLVSWFVAGSQKAMIDLRKGGACLLDFPRGVARGRAQLRWLATPSMLRTQK